MPGIAKAGAGFTAVPKVKPNVAPTLARPAVRRSDRVESSPITAPKKGPKNTPGIPKEACRLTVRSPCDYSARGAEAVGAECTGREVKGV